MRWVKPLILTGVICCGSGCVVHDRTGAPEPIWWPTVAVRESTLAPSNGSVNLQPDPHFLPPLTADTPVGRFADRPFEPRRSAQ